METIVSANGVSVEGCENKIKQVLEFFPIEELKFTETKNGEEYITKLAKAACVGIFNETRENVNDHAQEKIDEMESTLL